jgi:hypothetical protein
VYIGLNLDSGALMAVKQLDMFDASGTSVEAVEAEVSVLSRLSHPNIVAYLGTQRETSQGDASTLCIFLEYASGGSLKQLVERFGPLVGPTEVPLRAWLRQVLLGLEYLHRHGYAHRDLKAANVLLSADGTAKLADFGTAKKWSGAVSTGGAPVPSGASGGYAASATVEVPGGGAMGGSSSLGSSSSSSKSNGLQGTPLFIAPEVIQQQGALSKGWRKADVWSIGCMLVELSSGRPPWDGCITSPMQAMYLISCTDATPPIPADMSPLGKDFLVQCFQRDPDKRPSVTLLLLHPFVSSSSSPSSVAQPQGGIVGGWTSAATGAAAATAAAAHPASSSYPGEEQLLPRVRGKTEKEAAAGTSARVEGLSRSVGAAEGKALRSAAFLGSSLGGALAPPAPLIGCMVEAVQGPALWGAGHPPVPVPPPVGPLLERLQGG